MRRLFTFLCLLATGAAVASAEAETPVDYVRDVKPVLKEHCYRCHGASQQKNGLRLDTAASALKGGEHGSAFKPGDGAGSLLIQLVSGTHASLPRMPYRRTPLNEAQVALLKTWIDEGARAPADEQPERAVHWSFVAPVRPIVPKIANRKSQLANPIDAFIHARLAKGKIKPSPEADRYTLIRRLSLDLTGLPPTIEEVDAFVNDRSPDAYEKLVERLLASPHYGERWGRWWLDVARYADSNGYSIDAPRSIWKYRDWIVAALNRDQFFDQFVIEQIAGDMLPGATLEQKIATGFHRNTQINQEGGIDPEQFRIESVIDRVNTTATAFLGVTFACAQCHDHKFDPFTQREYYQFFAFLNNADEPTLEVPGEFEGHENLEREIEEVAEDLDRYLNTQGGPQQKWEGALTADELAKLKPAAREALRAPFAERTRAQKRTAYSAFKPDDPEFKQRNNRLTRLEKREAKPVTTMVMAERKKPRRSYLFIKGDFTRDGGDVTPGTPAILHPLRTEGPTNRLALARWLVDTNNPLLARVTVNRVWQQYFGKGLVETENDFGSQGALPSHPELLDWLACEFMHPNGESTLPSPGGEGRREGGQKMSRSADSNRTPRFTARLWSLKHLHRLIVTSATYRQSSKARPELATVDPNNKLLARQNRLRLDAEIVRDACLAASGLLNPKLGGPPVFPPQPDGVMTLGQQKREWKPNSGVERFRRGLYTHFWRATPHPALAVFDAPDAFSACTRRMRSNTPLQALTLLNDQQFYELAEGLAARVLRDAPHSDDARLAYAFRLCTARPPLKDESKRLAELLKRESHDGEKAAWTTVARVLLNLDETITRE